MSVYDLSDAVALNSLGWKPKATATLKNCKKSDLIDIIRCLEHNWAGEIKANKLYQQRLQHVVSYLGGEGYSIDEINHIISVEGENI